MDEHTLRDDIKGVFDHRLTVVGVVTIIGLLGGVSSTPRTFWRIGLGALLGLAFGFGFALLIERTQRATLPHPGDGSPTTKLRPPRLASISQVQPSGFGSILDDGALTDRFRDLRSSLVTLGCGTEFRSVSVVGVADSVGAATVAAALAASLSEIGQDVAVIDGHIENPTLHQFFGVAVEPGLSEVLAGAEDIADVGEMVESAVGAIAVIPAGALLTPTQDAAGVTSVLEVLGELADTVLIHSPPTSSEMTSSFVEVADVSLLVADVDDARPEVVDAAVEELQRLGSAVVGFVTVQIDQTSDTLAEPAGPALRGDRVMAGLDVHLPRDHARGELVAEPHASDDLSSDVVERPARELTPTAESAASTAALVSAAPEAEQSEVAPEAAVESIEESVVVDADQADSLRQFLDEIHEPPELIATNLVAVPDDESPSLSDESPAGVVADGLAPMSDAASDLLLAMSEAELISNESEARRDPAVVHDRELRADLSDLKGLARPQRSQSTDDMSSPELAAAADVASATSFVAEVTRVSGESDGDTDVVVVSGESDGGTDVVVVSGESDGGTDVAVVSGEPDGDADADADSGTDTDVAVVSGEPDADGDTDVAVASREPDADGDTDVAVASREPDPHAAAAALIDERLRASETLASAPELSEALADLRTFLDEPDDASTDTADVGATAHGADLDADVAVADVDSDGDVGVADVDLDGDVGVADVDLDGDGAVTDVDLDGDGAVSDGDVEPVADVDSDSEVAAAGETGLPETREVEGNELEDDLAADASIEPPASGTTRSGRRKSTGGKDRSKEPLDGQTSLFDELRGLQPRKRASRSRKRTSTKNVRRSGPSELRTSTESEDRLSASVGDRRALAEAADKNRDPSRRSGPAELQGLAPAVSALGSTEIDEVTSSREVEQPEQDLREDSPAPAVELDLTAEEVAPADPDASALAEGERGDVAAPDPAAPEELLGEPAAEDESQTEDVALAIDARESSQDLEDESVLATAQMPAVVAARPVQQAAERIGASQAADEESVPGWVSSASTAGGPIGDNRGPFDVTAEMRLETNEAALARRERLIGDVESALEWRLKWVLTNEQTRVLSSLRQSGAGQDLTALLSSRDVHIGNYTDAIRAQLEAAFAAGRRYARSGDEGRLDPPAALGLTMIGDSVVDPLRARITTLIDEVGPASLPNAVRDAYQQLKTRRIAHAASQIALSTFAAGTLSALPSSARLRWVPCTTDGSCAAAVENAKAEGGVLAGAPFPSGASSPPTSLSCRCAVLPL